MDRIFTTRQRHRRDAHRIARRAPGNDGRHVRLVTPHFAWRRPGRVEILAVDLGGAGPLLAGPADADRVAHGLALTDNEIEPALIGLDHDGSRRIVAAETDHIRPRLGLCPTQYADPDGGHERRRNPQGHHCLRFRFRYPRRGRQFLAKTLQNDGLPAHC